MPTVHLLDYVAGNVRSLVNAINQVGYEVEWVRSPQDLKNAEVRICILLGMAKTHATFLSSLFKFRD